MSDGLADIEIEVVKRLKKYHEEQAALPPEERDCNKKQTDSNGNVIAAVISACL